MNFSKNYAERMNQITNLFYYEIQELIKNSEAVIKDMLQISKQSFKDKKEPNISIFKENNINLNCLNCLLYENLLLIRKVNRNFATLSNGMELSKNKDYCQDETFHHKLEYQNNGKQHLQEDVLLNNDETELWKKESQQKIDDDLKYKDEARNENLADKPNATKDVYTLIKDAKNYSFDTALNSIKLEAGKITEEEQNFNSNDFKVKNNVCTNPFNIASNSIANHESDEIFKDEYNNATDFVKDTCNYPVGSIHNFAKNIYNAEILERDENNAITNTNNIEDFVKDGHNPFKNSYKSVQITSDTNSNVFNKDDKAKNIINNIYQQKSNVKDTVKDVYNDTDVKNSFDSIDTLKNCDILSDNEDDQYIFENMNVVERVLGKNLMNEYKYCRFYDSESGGCFKGSYCKQIHEPLDSNGWSMATKMAQAYLNNNAPVIIYPKGIKIKLLVTNIDKITEFWAQVINNDNSNTFLDKTQLIWTDKDIKPWMKLQSPPEVYDIVLARYLDNNWYRAQIVQYNHSKQRFYIFYIDYGNYQWVNIRNLVICENRSIRIPNQAQLCRIANILPLRTNPFFEDITKTLITRFRKMLINKTISAIVEDFREDLLVNIQDKIFDTLMEECKSELT